MNNVSTTATGNVTIRFNANSSGSNYSSGYIKSGTTPSNNTNQGVNSAIIAQLDSTSQTGNGVILTVYDYANATSANFKYFSFISSATDNTMVYGTGVWRVTNTAINQIQILISGTGSYDTGTYILYGVK
jgi:hypothetical protein